MQIAERAAFLLRSTSFQQFEKGTRFMHFASHKQKLAEIDLTKQYLLKLASESEKYLTMPDLNSNQKFILKERKSFFRKLFRFTTASYVCLMSQFTQMTSAEIRYVLDCLKQLDNIHVKHPNDKISQAYVKAVEDFLLEKEQCKTIPEKDNEERLHECYKELYRVTLNELASLDSLQELRMFEDLHRRIKSYFKPRSASRPQIQTARSSEELPVGDGACGRKIGITRSRTFVFDS